MKISIIIPVLNEEKNIEKTIYMLDKLEGDKEVIFVDGGSQDGTIKLIPQHYMVVNSQRGRALQMNKGIEYASGEVLLFLHCDSVFDSRALYYIESEVVDKGFIGGCFSMKFDEPDLLLSIIAFLSNLRVNTLKIMFGDQGIFIKKDAFKQIGGYPEIPIMEDWEMSKRLKGKGKIKQINCKIITSSRRFKDKGTIRTIMFMHKLKLLYLMGKSPEKLSLMYKDVR